MRKTLILITIILLFYSLKLYSQEVFQDTLFNVLKKEVELAKTTSNTKKLVEKQYLLGKQYAENHINTKAVESFNNAIAYYKNNTPDTLLVGLYDEMGSIYFSSHNYASAINYFSDALEISKKINYVKGKAKALSKLGNVNEKEGNYIKALELQNESLNFFTLLNEKLEIAKINKNIGSIYEDLNQFNNAFQYFLKSYTVLKETNTYDEADVLNNLGDIYRKQGKYRASIPYTKQALALANKLNNPHLQESANKDLSKAYYFLNDFKTAYDYRLKSQAYKEIALVNENTKQLNALQSVYSLNEKEAEIQLLKEKNKVSKINQQFLVIVFLGVFSLITILLYFNAKKRKANARVQKYKQQVLQAELEKQKIQETEMQNRIKIKTASLSKYSLSLSQKNKTLSNVASYLKKLSKREHIDFQKKLKTIAKEIEFELKQDNELEEFNKLFSEIHPDFSKNLLEKATNKLTVTEIKLAMLLRLNLSSKEIASILKVTPDSVRVARHRLRKKLPINSKKELVNFMLEL